MKRFKYFEHTQMITDSTTGYTYTGNQEICDLLNELSERGDRIIESFTTEELIKLKWQRDIYKNFSKETMKILNKHEIKSLAKLDLMLMEQEVW